MVDNAILLPQLHFGIVATLNVVSTGAPASYALRAAIEVSHNGTDWFQVVRWQDVVADGVSFFRAAAQAAASATLNAAASNLANAAGAAVVVETPWPRNIRAVTKLQTLTGGTVPTITATMLLSEAN